MVVLRWGLSPVNHPFMYLKLLPPPLAFLYLVAVLALLQGCEKDTDQLTIEPLDATQFQHDASFATSVPDLYVEAGDIYREDLFHYEQDLATETITLPSSTNNIYLGTHEDIKGALLSYSRINTIGAADLEKLFEFDAAIIGLGLTPDMTLGEGRQVVERWMRDHGVTVEQFPLTYHTISIAIESLFENQITKLQKESKVQNLKGSESNSLCTVKGLLCTKTNSFVSSAAQAALGLGIKQVFKKVSDWTDVQQAAAAAAVVLIIDTFWDDIFCIEDCDDCGPAAGIRAVYNGCNFTGIQAVGSFEFVERFRYAIDINQDGAPDQVIPIENSNVGFIPKTSLPTAGFKASVEVLCDGGKEGKEGSIMPWPGGTLGLAYIDPRLPVAPARPTANFTAPPKKGSPYPYYYDTNTQLCFGMTNLATRGWTFVRWQTSGGGTPSTGTSTSNFCTKFSASQPTTFSVSAVFSHPCSPTNYVLSGPSFVVCPMGACD